MTDEKIIGEIEDELYESPYTNTFVKKVIEYNRSKVKNDR